MTKIQNPLDRCDFKQKFNALWHRAYSAIRFINGKGVEDGEGSVTLTAEDIPDVQPLLTAGENITIEDNVISATGGGSTPVWGNITGTLEDQTDLQNALDGKEDAGTAYTKAESDALLSDKADVASVESIEDEIGAVGQAGTIRNDIALVNDRVDAVEDEIGPETTAGTLRFKIKENSNDIVSIENEIDVIDGIIASHSTAINGKADKTYVDNELAAKADDINVLHKTGNETVNGIKTFTSTVKTTNNCNIRQNDLPTNTSIPASTKNTFLNTTAVDDSVIGALCTFTQASGNRCTYIKTVGIDGLTEKRLDLWQRSNNTAYVTAPYRSYSSASNDDVLVKAHAPDLPISTSTQTALDDKANDTAVIHKTGNEIKSGALQVTSLNVASTNAVIESYIDGTSGQNFNITIKTPNGDGILFFVMRDNGTLELILAKILPGQPPDFRTILSY